MHKRSIRLALILVVILAFAASGGVALGKGHVPADEVQVSHRGIVKQYFPILVPIMAGPTAGRADD